MIVVKIIGGLGNQLFQLAYALHLNKNEKKVFLDISSFKTYKLHGGYQLRNFNHSLPILKSSLIVKIFKLFFKTIKYEKLKFKNFNFIFLKYNNIYLDGYFQNENYFNESEKFIKDCLIKSKLNESDTFKKIKKKIISENTCSIHVRRGDYTNPKNIKIHGLLNLKYYEDAIEIIKKKGVQNFIVFSDDIDWCKKNLKFSKIDMIYSDSGLSQIEDLFLMSFCSSNIIANSSFSWWGAWLNQNPNKIVIAPKKWLVNDSSVDVIPKNWIKI